MTRSRAELGFRRWMAAFFDQQMWCLGRDIARPAGNLLLDLGLCRYRPAKPDAGSTLYTAPVPPGGSVFVWGFGAMYAEPEWGGVFVRRYDFSPRLTDRVAALGVHAPADLGRLVSPATPRDLARVRRLLPALVGWFAKYEHWVAENHGAAYRAGCLAASAKAAVVPATRMADEWERAEKKCRRYRLPTAPRPTPWGRLLVRIRGSISTARRAGRTHRPPTRAE